MGSQAHPQPNVKPGAVANPAHGGFQSSEALAASQTRPLDLSGEEPISGEVTPPTPVEVERAEDPDRMVRVRSRQYIAPFRYGTKMYQVPANQPTLLPLGVKRHLEEKGYSL